MRTVFMGTPNFAVPVLEALCGGSAVEVVAVYTPPDRPKGRGREVESTPVKIAALQLNLPVLQPASLRSARVQEKLAALRPDVIVVAAYGKLLPSEVLDLPPHGCLNIHPSLLPKYRGPSPVVSTLLDGVGETGVTLMLLDEGMDTGPIVAQRKLTLAGTETAEMLTQELFRVGGDLLLETLDPWTSGLVDALYQDHSNATVTRKLERSDGLVDWGLPASVLERKQRAFTPWPGLFTKWQKKSLRLLEVSLLDGQIRTNSIPAAEPGEVVALDTEETPIGIGTAQGILGVKQLQLEGRRAASASEFLRGYPNLIGSRL